MSCKSCSMALKHSNPSSLLAALHRISRHCSGSRFRHSRSLTLASTAWPMYTQAFAISQAPLLSSTPRPLPVSQQPRPSTQSSRSFTTTTPTSISHYQSHRPVLSSLLRPSLSTVTSRIIPKTTQSQPQTRTFTTTTALLAPRNTYRPSHRKRKRKHGYLSRVKTRTGQQILKRRRQKGRVNLSH